MRDYKNYNSSWGISYKQGRILGASFGSEEVIKVQVDNRYAYFIEVKSIRAAKIMITKHSKKALK